MTIHYEILVSDDQDNPTDEYCYFGNIDSVLARHRRGGMAIDISKTGGIISEYPPEMDIEQSHMSATNRLIVGMADAVVAMELSTNSERSLDLLDFCDQIGKLTFVLVDPRTKSTEGKAALERALASGAIPVTGVDSVDDIVKSLV